VPLTRSPFAAVVALAIAVLVVIVVLSGGVKTSLAVLFLAAVDVTLIVGRGGWSRKTRRTRRRPARAPMESAEPVACVPQAMP